MLVPQFPPDLQRLGRIGIQLQGHSAVCFGGLVVGLVDEGHGAVGVEEGRGGGCGDGLVVEFEGGRPVSAGLGVCCLLLQVAGALEVFGAGGCGEVRGGVGGAIGGDVAGRGWLFDGRGWLFGFGAQ